MNRIFPFWDGLLIKINKGGVGWDQGDMKRPRLVERGPEFLMGSLIRYHYLLAIPGRIVVDLKYIVARRQAAEIDLDVRFAARVADRLSKRSVFIRDLYLVNFIGYGMCRGGAGR